MRIEVNQFSGIRPTITPMSLGPTEAQTATNCKFRSGALAALSSDLPTYTAPTFSFADGFGTWTLSGAGKLQLGSVDVNQSAPTGLTASAVTALTQSDFSLTTFSCAANAASVNQPAQITSYELSGTIIKLVVTANPAYLSPTSTTATDAITGVSRVAKVTVNSVAYQSPGDTGALAGSPSVGSLRLVNVTIDPCTVTWKLPAAAPYQLYVSGWTATFEFAINFSTDLGIERAVVYRVTNVESSGIETPASAATSILALMPNQYAKLEGLGTSKIKRIYRAAGTTLNARYYFVAQVAAGTGTYSDTVAEADLGEAMPEIENPPTMTQVVWLPGGFLAGFSGKDVYFSDPFMLYSWNSDNTLTVQKTIVGLAVSGNDLIVLTEPPTGNDTNAKNYIITGVSPDVMTMSELMVNQGCSARNSICKVGTTVGFAAPEGFVLITGGIGKVVTEPFYNRTQWQALTPSNMVCKEYDNQVVIFTSNIGGATAGLILDYVNGTMRTFSGSGSGNFTWRSKVFEFPEPVEFHVAQLVGDSGTHTLTLYADGAASPVYTGTITANTDLRVTQGLAAARRWEFQIVGSTLVNRITLIHRERIVVNGPMRLVPANTEGSWRGLMFQFPDSGRFKVIRVRASAYNVTAAFYRDTTSDSSNTITSDAEVRLTQQTDNDLWEVDITASGEVYELMLVPRMVKIVTGPVVLQNLQHLRGHIFQFPGRGSFNVGRVRGADGGMAGTLNLYANEAATATVTVAVTTDIDFRITGLGNCELVEVDFVPTNQTIQVDEIFLMPRKVETVAGPIVMRDRATWKGMVFQFPEKGSFKVGRLRGPAGTVTGTLNFYVDEAGSATVSTAITTDADFRITGVNAAELVEVEFVPTDQTIKCDELVLIPRTVQRVNGPVVLSKENRLSWRGTVVQFPDTGTFKVVRARGRAGSVTATLNLYADEAASVTRTVSITSDTDVRLDLLTPNELWEIEVVPTGELDELVLIPRTVQTVTGPVVLRSENRLSWKGNVFWFPRSGWFKVARARGAPSATLGTLNLRADESNSVTLATTLSNDTDLRLTEQTAGDLWEVEITGNGDLDEVVLWPQSEQEINSPVIHVSRGASQGPATWLAQAFRYQEPVRVRTAVVKSRTYPVTLTVYCDGTQVGGSPYTVADAKEFRLNVPSAIGRVWEFDAAVSGVIDSVTLFVETIQDVDVAAFYLKYDGVKGNVSTLARVMRFRRDECFNCAKVEASAYPVTLKLYRDYGKTPIYTAQVLNSSGFRLPKLQPARTWEIDAIPKDTATIIHAVALAKSMAMLRA